MIDSLLQIVIAASIFVVLFFAFMTKSKLARYVAFTILAAVAASMALNGLAGLISDVDFLSFLESFIRLLSDIIVYIELGIIVFLLFMSKFKTKIMVLKVAIIVYGVLTLLLALGVF